VHCQSQSDSPLQLPIQEHVTRFGTDPLARKIREKFVPRTFAKLIEHRIIDPATCGGLEIGSPVPHDEALATIGRQGRFAIVGTLGGHIASMAEVSHDPSTAKFVLHKAKSAPGLCEKQLSRARTEFLTKAHSRAKPAISGRLAYGPAILKLRGALKSPPLDVLRKTSAHLAALSNQQVVAWDQYARAYDVMCSANPAYQENLALFRNWLQRAELSEHPRVCDVGAGTGNYLLEVASARPNAELVHLDLDPGMNNTASRKYQERKLPNVAFELSDVHDAKFEEESFDILVCVNSLYTMREPERAIARMRSWLKTNGWLFIIDLGRPMEVGDWAKFIVASSLRTVGLKRTIRAFVRGRQAITQNRHIRASQDLGTYWLHSQEEFRAFLEAANLKIVEAGTCYRGACDFAVCTTN
jgi:ubiquinone/menaquinone biosynthesis C-methylase UbiE